MLWQQQRSFVFWVRPAYTLRSFDGLAENRLRRIRRKIGELCSERPLVHRKAADPIRACLVVEAAIARMLLQAAHKVPHVLTPPASKSIRIDCRRRWLYVQQRMVEAHTSVKQTNLAAGAFRRRSSARRASSDEMLSLVVRGMHCCRSA